MNEPKISVVIPVYNRKTYIQDCVNSVLNQTFQDFDIVIRDDGSKDGSAELVEEVYAKEISAGKIKLFRNGENRGEYRTVRQLLESDATGKYIHILHSDDVFLPYALQHVYEIAEKTNADVVHSIGNLNGPADRTLNPDSLKPRIHDARPVKQIVVMPDDPKFRFAEWAIKGTFCDIQYNLFSKKFIRENELMFDPSNFGLNLFLLFWLMKAKVFVKTPALYYVRRESPNSITNRPTDSLKHVNGYVSAMMRFSRMLDDLLPRIKFFSDNPDLKRFVKFKFMTEFEFHEITRRQFYKDGVSPELWEAVESAFRKYLGDENAFYPAILFTWMQSVQFGRDPYQIMLQQALKSLEDSAPPQRYELAA